MKVYKVAVIVLLLGIMVGSLMGARASFTDNGIYTAAGQATVTPEQLMKLESLPVTTQIQSADGCSLNISYRINGPRDSEAFRLLQAPPLYSQRARGFNIFGSLIFLFIAAISVCAITVKGVLRD